MPQPCRRRAHTMCLPMALALSALLAVLSGCASGGAGAEATGEAKKEVMGEGISLPKLPDLPDLPSVPAVATVKPTTKDSGVTERVGQAAITPLSDLNVVQEVIPASLQIAAQGPYAPPQAPGCEAIATEVAALDEALGADLDDPKASEKPSLLTRGTDLAENAGVSAVRRTVEGFVPFRSWLRKLSGAEKHSKQVGAAITAGGIRRAYLKGRGDAMGCVRPASAMATATAAAAKVGEAEASPASAPAASATATAGVPAPRP